MGYNLVEFIYYAIHCELHSQLNCICVSIFFHPASETISITYMNHYSCFNLHSSIFGSCTSFDGYITWFYDTLCSRHKFQKLHQSFHFGHCNILFGLLHYEEDPRYFAGIWKLSDNGLDISMGQWALLY